MIESANNRLLCRPVSMEQKKGAIILSGEKKQYQMAVVINIGPDAQTSAFVGDLIYAHRNSGLVLDLDTADYISFRDDELIAIEHVQAEDE